MRQFDNLFNISKPIVTLRVRQLDIFAEVNLYTSASTTPNGDIIEPKNYISVESNLSDNQLINLFSAPETAEEQIILTNFIASMSDFESLPDWSTWTATETETNITNLIFNGQSATVIKSNIASQLTDITIANVSQINTRLAVIRALLGNAVDAIIAVRTILIGMGKAIVYFRNIIVKLRR